MNRRSFIGVAGATALAGLTGASGSAANALAACSPARPVPGRRIETIGLQLYTVRSELEKDFTGTLARIASIGYSEVEFAGYFGRSPSQVRSELERARLSAPAGHFPLDQLESRLGETIEFARAVGHQYMVLPWLARERRATLESYRQLARQMNEFGTRIGDSGLVFAYHNHDFEFTPLDGAIPYDLLLSETDPAVVKLELDVYWITRAGYDPLDYFTRHAGRFPLVHVKDSAGAPEHTMVDVGAGVIDWGQVLGASGQAGIRHVFVEHDNPADPAASIAVSFAHLKQLQLEGPRQ